MAIEFTCEQCGSRLRVPDDHAGGQARCPACERVMPIPLSQTAEGPAATIAAGDNRFAGSPDDARPLAGPPMDAANPYQTPAAVHVEPWVQKVEGGVLKHRLCRLEEILQRTWHELSSNLAIGILFGLIIIAIHIGSSIVTVPLGFVREAVPELVVIIGATVVEQVWNLVVQAFTSCLSVNFALAAIRRHPNPLSAMFEKLGRVLLPVLAVQVLLILIGGFLFALAAAPVLIDALITWGNPNPASIAATLALAIVAVVVSMMIFFKWFLVTFFIIDDEMGIVESIAASNQFMRGNKLTAFAAVLLTGILGALFMLVTCCIGVLAYIPFFTFLTAVIYLTATGQLPVPPAPLLTGRETG